MVMFEEYFMDNMFISDIKKLGDDIYQLRRNIKEYIGIIKENIELDGFLEKQFSIMIDKLESFNEGVFMFTQYSRYIEYDNVNIEKEEIQQFYEDVCYTRGYIKGLIGCPKISFACAHVALQKNYGYIIKD